MTEQYNRLYKDAVQKIKEDRYEIDEYIDSPSDNRFGITLIIRPDRRVKNQIRKFLDRLRMIEAQQYFYPESDMHVTVMSIISCYDGFDLSQIPTDEYIRIIQKSIPGISSFEIEFRGLTASPDCLMVQGFLRDDTLHQFRDILKRFFLNSDLPQSIDKRYTIQTAHSTIFRLKEKLQNKTEYLRLIEEYRDFYFGTTRVDTLELVFNDWYQREEHVKELYRFEL